MENTKKVKIICLVAALIGFFIEVPFKGYILPPFYFIQPVYMLVDSVVYAAIFLPVLVVTKNFISKANVFKIIGVAAGFAVLDWIFSLIGILTVVFIYQIIRPIVAVALLMLLFKWITKSRVAVSKPIVITGACVLATGTVFTVFEYLVAFQNMQIMQSLGNGFTDYLQVFNSASSVQSEVSVFLFFVLIFLASLMLIKSLESADQPHP